MHILILLIIALGVAPMISAQALARFATFLAVLILVLGVLIAHPWLQDDGMSPQGRTDLIEMSAVTAGATWAFLRGLAWVFGARFGD